MSELVSDQGTQHTGERAHFGDAEESAFRLGSTYAIEAISSGAVERVQAALDRAFPGHTYDVATRSVLAEDGRHWHTLGSLGMYELFGHSEAGRQMAKAANLLIEFAVDQALLAQSGGEVG